MEIELRIIRAILPAIIDTATTTAINANIGLFIRIVADWLLTKRTLAAAAATKLIHLPIN